MHSGDFTLQETHVPIPNTTVKLLGPTIVPKGAKIGHRRELSSHLARGNASEVFFYFATLFCELEPSPWRVALKSFRSTFDSAISASAPFLSGTMNAAVLAFFCLHILSYCRKCLMSS